MIKEAVKAGSVEEAADLKKAGYYFLGGGTAINWVQSDIKPEKVVMLEGIVPEGMDSKDGTLLIGAMTTLQNIADSPDVPGVLKEAARYIPSRNIRNMATIGGNIAANRADSYIIPALLALKAKVVTFEEGELSVDEYISGSKSSLILKVLIPELKGVSIIDRSVRSSAAYPSAVSAVYYSGDDCIIALGCVADRVIRLETVEEGVVSGKLKTEEDLFNAVYGAIDPRDDLKETGTYKRYIASTMIARQVQSCMRGEA